MVAQVRGVTFKDDGDGTVSMPASGVMHRRADKALDDVMLWLGFGKTEHEKYLRALYREGRRIFKRVTR